MNQPKVDLPSVTERHARLEEAKRTEEAQMRRAAGPWRFRAPGPEAGDGRDLIEAVERLLPHLMACAVCGAAALRCAKGLRALKGIESSAEVLLCDICEPPAGGTPLARFKWFQPFDLPYAPALRRVLLLLGDHRG